MFILSLITPTALLRRAVQEETWLSPEVIDSYTQVFEKKVSGSVVVINHDRQSEYQLEQLVSVLSQENPSRKILVLTANYSSGLARRLYANGADICLAFHVGSAVLPFLLKRLFHSAHVRDIQVLSQKNIELNVETGSLKLASESIQLRPRETQILTCLLQRSNQTVTRDVLIENVWNYEFEPASSTIDVYIRRLRKRLGIYNPCIETIRGFGYKLNLEKLAV